MSTIIQYLFNTYVYGICSRIYIKPHATQKIDVPIRKVIEQGMPILSWMLWVSK